MPTTINKGRIVTHLLQAPGLVVESPSEPLPVLEQFIYALCRENATAEQARQAFQNLKSSFYCWDRPSRSLPARVSILGGRYPQSRPRNPCNQNCPPPTS